MREDWRAGRHGRGPARRRADIARQGAAQVTTHTRDPIGDALRYAVDELIPRGHRYLVNFRGPREIHRDEHCAFQVVPQTMPYRDGELGLTIHLAFDHSHGPSETLLRFLESPLRHLFDAYAWSGIPCFALRLGDDVETAVRVLRLLLTDIHGYLPGVGVECKLHDEGPLEGARKRQRQAPKSPPRA